MSYPSIDAAQAAADRAASYGVVQTGVPVDGSYHETVDHSDPMTLAELAAEGGKVSRLRLLTERGYPYMDISYAHGTLPSGQVVALRLDGADRLSRRSLKGDLIAWAKRQGVYAKGLGLLDEGNWSILYG